MRQREEEFQFFKVNKKAEKSIAYTLLIPFLAFLFNLLLTFSIVSYFSHPEPIAKTVQINVVNLEHTHTNPTYGINYEQVYQNYQKAQQESEHEQSNHKLNKNQNEFNKPLTPEEITQINQYLKP